MAEFRVIKFQICWVILFGFRKFCCYQLIALPSFWSIYLIRGTGKSLFTGIVDPGCRGSRLPILAKVLLCLFRVGVTWVSGQSDIWTSFDGELSPNPWFFCVVFCCCCLFGSPGRSWRSVRFGFNVLIGQGQSYYPKMLAHLKTVSNQMAHTDRRTISWRLDFETESSQSANSVKREQFRLSNNGLWKLILLGVMHPSCMFIWFYHVFTIQRVTPWPSAVRGILQA